MNQRNKHVARVQKAVGEIGIVRPPGKYMVPDVLDENMMVTVPSFPMPEGK